MTFKNKCFNTDIVVLFDREYLSIKSVSLYAVKYAAKIIKMRIINAFIFILIYKKVYYR